jgi:uncharacterized protein (TIGR03437 family)
MGRLATIGFFLIWLSISLTAEAQTTFAGRIVDLVSGNGIPEVTITVSKSCLQGHGLPILHIPLGSGQTDADGKFSVTYSDSPNYPVCIQSLVSYSIQKPGYSFSGGTVRRGGEQVYLGTNLPPLTSVSAAGFFQNFTTEAITAAFGADLASSSEAAISKPLPTSLAGRQLLVSDSQGVEKAAELFFVSPGQINYVVPAGLGEGLAVIKLISDNQLIRAGFIWIEKFAPSIFTANSNGQGVAAAVVQRVKADGSVGYEPVARFDAAQNRFVSFPIDLGPESDKVYLILFGTGWRHRSSLSAMRVRIGDPETEAPLVYAGPQPDFTGLDQANVLLPRSLAGSGEVDVKMAMDREIPEIPNAAWMPANYVRINIR